MLNSNVFNIIIMLTKPIALTFVCARCFKKMLLAHNYSALYSSGNKKLNFKIFHKFLAENEEVINYLF